MGKFDCQQLSQAYAVLAAVTREHQLQQQQQQQPQQQPKQQHYQQQKQQQQAHGSPQLQKFTSATLAVADVADANFTPEMSPEVTPITAQPPGTAANRDQARMLEQHQCPDVLGQQQQQHMWYSTAVAPLPLHLPEGVALLAALRKSTRQRLGSFKPQQLASIMAGLAGLRQQDDLLLDEAAR